MSSSGDSLVVECNNLQSTYNHSAFKNLLISFHGQNGTKAFQAVGQLLCHTENSKPYIDWLGPIAFLPFTFSIAQLFFMIENAGNDRTLSIMSYYAYVIWYIAYCMQAFIAQPRPYPMCSAYWFSDYGLPCPEVVYLSSLATLALCRATFMRKGGSIRTINIIWMILLWLIYPAAHYVAHLSTLSQLIFSMSMGTFSTLFVCLFINMLDISSFLNYMAEGLYDIESVTQKKEKHDTDISPQKIKGKKSRKQRNMLESSSCVGGADIPGGDFSGGKTANLTNVGKRRVDGMEEV